MNTPGTDCNLSDIDAALSRLAATHNQRVHELEMQRDALANALRTILKGFEQGVFVRSIVHDNASGWAVQLLPFISALGKAQAALAAVPCKETP